MANTLSAFGRVRVTSGKSKDLFLQSAQVILDNTELGTWSDRNLVEVGYAYMKVNCPDYELLDNIGLTITNKEKVELNAQELGNLAACFSRQEVSSSRKV